MNNISSFMEKSYSAGKVGFILLLLIFPFYLFSQEKTIIQSGFGLPIFFRQNFSEPGYGDQNLKNRQHFFVEKPFFIKSYHNFSVTPGTGYFYFSEYYENGGLGQHSYKELKHNSLSIYSKMNYHFKTAPAKSIHYYCGIIGGTYLYTKTKGESSWYRLQESGYVGGNSTIDENGQEFFHSFYYGFLGGFKFRFSKESIVSPVIECSFYPGFVTVDQKRRSMVMLSVMLKLNKKATRSPG